MTDNQNVHTHQLLDNPTEVWLSLVHGITGTAVGLLTGSREDSIRAFDGVMNALPLLHNHFASGGDAPELDFMDVDGPDLNVPMSMEDSPLPDFLRHLLSEMGVRPEQVTIVEVSNKEVTTVRLSDDNTDDDSDEG